MTEPVDYAVFYEQLAGLVASRETGTLYLKNDANHVAIIGVRAGTIVSLVCGPRRGRPAVDLIRKTRSGTVRLDRGALAFREHELPSTPDILDLLSPLRGALGPASTGHSAAAGPVPPGGVGRAQILCNLLTEFIGPVAPLVCEEKIVASGGLTGPEQMDEVIQCLAQEIENPQEALEFARRAQQALHLAGPSERSDSGVSGQGGDVAIDISAWKEPLCDLLTGYLGPVAPLVCEEHISPYENGATQAQLEHLIRNIAAEIGNVEEAAEFVTKAWEQLAAVTR